MQHGGYGRPQAIPRGILIESEKEVQDYVDAIVAALAPRDAPEFVIARRIATSDLRLARLERFESVALAQVSRVRSDLGEATQLEVEMAMEFATAAHVAALCLIPENRLVVDVETWTTIATVLWRMHQVPPSEHLEPDISYDDDAAPAVWRRFILEILIPKYWDSSEAAFAALEAESQRWADFYRDVDGKAEERAVVAALAKDGPIDSVSILRARVQREGDRDRATYAKLQQRMLADDEAGEDAAETVLA